MRRWRDAAATYVYTLGKMSALEGDAGMPTGRACNWNRLVSDLQAARKELVTSAAGREFVSSLLDDPRVTVRLWAARHALHWDQAKAKAVLEDISADAKRFGLNRLNAEMTLREFDAGRLDPDW